MKDWHDSSWETQGQILGATESLNGQKYKKKLIKKYIYKAPILFSAKRLKIWHEEKKRLSRRALGTMSYQTSSKLSPLFWFLIGTRNLCVFLPNQKAERRQPFGTGLVRHCPQGLFSPFFTFLRAIFSRPFRLSLAPAICPWVSEDGHDLFANFH